MDILTGCQNAACIKIFRKEYLLSRPVPHEGEAALPTSKTMLNTVTTLYRDTQSYRSRRENDVRIPKMESLSNSAFVHILSRDTKDFFYLNNSLEDDCTYVNCNPRWREFYNATIVSPIRIENFSFDANDPASERYHIYGFLCLDSQKAKYRKDIELQYLFAFADLYVPILYAFDIWQQTALGQTENGTKDKTSTPETVARAEQSMHSGEP